MRGRKSKLNWTPSVSQFTCTIDGQFHRLGADKEEAETAFAFLVRQAEKGVSVDTSISIGEVADAWLDFTEKHHSPVHYKVVKPLIENFATFVGINYRAKDIRVRHVEAWAKGRQVKPGAERSYKAVVLACLNWASKPRCKRGGELMAENPIKGQIYLPPPGARGEEAVWTKQTYEQVLKHSCECFTNVVKMLAWTGCRPSTLCRIEARHYNRLHRRWDVEDLYRGSRTKHVKHVRLSRQAASLVERLNAKHPTGAIFRNTRGKPWTPEKLKLYLYRLLYQGKNTKKLDWQAGLCLYGLRHTFATHFLAEHPNEIEYLRVLLGHKDYTMILQHYGHLVELHEAIQARMDTFNPFGD